MQTKKVTINLKFDLIEKLRENKHNTGLPLDRQVNQAISNYFKYQKKSHCKKF